MSLATRIGSWFGRSAHADAEAMERAAAEAMGFHVPGAADFGPGIGNQPSHEALLRGSQGIADTAMRAIANRLSTLTPVVKVKRRVRDGTVVEDVLDDHVLKAALDRPHPNFTRSQLLRLLGQHIGTVGEAYWLKVANGFGLPTEFHPIPPAQVTPLVHLGVIQSYILRDGAGKPTEVGADTVCRFVFPDPENIWGSEGYLAPEGMTADSLNFAGQHLRRHYEHDATPKMALEPGEKSLAFTDTESKRFNLEWIKKYHHRSGLNKGGPAILPLGYKLIQMMMASGADVVPLLEFWRDEQLMGYGVPRSVLGQVVSGDRSAAEVNQYVFDRHAVLPFANLIADAMTLQIAHDFDPNIYVEFESFVSADKEFELKQESSDLVSKVRSINLVREDRGLDTVDWGELPVAKIGEQPYDPDGFMELTPDVPGALGDDEDDEEPRVLPSVQRKRMRAFFTPANEWQRQIKREKKFTPAFRAAMRTIFRDQLKSVLAKLNALEEPRARAVTVESLFNPDEWERLFTVRAEPVRTAAFKSIMAETLDGLGAGDAFNFTDEMQATLNEQGAQLVKHANKTTQKRIAAQISKGTSEGESIGQIAKRIEHVFSSRGKQARTIARTEVLKASQTAQLEGFETSGVVEQKQWNDNQDADVRDEHAFANGQVVALGDSFDLAGEAADAPGIGAGGGALSAGNTINCRCFLTPVMEE